MVISNLCDFSDADVVLKGTITVVRPNNAKTNSAKRIQFKNNCW